MRVAVAEFECLEWRWNEIEKSLGDGKDQKFRLLFIGTRPKDGFPMCSDVVTKALKHSS